MSKWKPQVEEQVGQIPMVVVQTKIDLIDSAAMTEEEVDKMSGELKLPVFKTCAKDGVNISEVFTHLADKFLKSRKEGSSGAAQDGPIMTIKQIQETPAHGMKLGQKSVEPKKKKKGFLASC